MEKVMSVDEGRDRVSEGTIGQLRCDAFRPVDIADTEEQRRITPQAKSEVRAALKGMSAAQTSIQNILSTTPVE
jgi:hypothetical protein